MQKSVLRGPSPRRPASLFATGLAALALLALLAAPLARAADNGDSGGQNSGDNIGSASGNNTSAEISQIDYVLQPYDLIHIVVFQEPDLERQVRLSDDSKVSLPLIGLVDLKNKTIAQAQRLIRDLYNKDYLVNPQITLTVLEFAKETVNVLGSVNNPGAIPIPPDQPLNLVDAITRAGGFTRLADRRKVKLSEPNADGTTTTIIVNVDEIIQSQAPDDHILKKGDVIFVPERIL